MTGENVFTLEQVIDAAGDLGLIHGPRGSFDVKDVIGPMTGLNMDRYDIVEEFDACGWRIVRKNDA